ncbi:MAG: 3-dehydroquinate synthase [Deltaproteobacteria bacterium]|nr:3-dehydroquinate synthase [Deltaproteobacteria bacterium]MCL5276968.1 3-dehydroquinate synthase [Deltaproteobacteria bacterium]
MRKTVPLKLRAMPHEYNIAVTDEAPFASLVGRVRSMSWSSLVIVTNTVVDRLYGKAIGAAFRRGNLRYESIVLPDGERHKSLDTIQKIYGRLLSYNADRDSVLIGIGGGVIGDITGFAASTYMRGVRYVQVPTTLLAQVDAAIGGKTAVDYSFVKNIVGTFHQPAFVYSNINLLGTLPARIYRAGIAETIKYGVVKDRRLFLYIESHKDDILNRTPGTLLSIVYGSSRIKALFVEEDEKETSGARALLNFGHTFAHAIESSTHYRVLHGEAVGLGMIMAARLSHLLGLCQSDVPERVEQTVKGFKLPASLDNIGMQDLSKSIDYDKKGRADKINLILLSDIGRPMTYRMDKKELKKILTEVKI